MGKLIDCDIIPLGSDSEATVKDRFYLDKLIRVNDGFVGACIDGGGQQNMHNPDRFGSVRFLQDGVIYRAFKDGGVNTLGNALNLESPDFDVFLVAFSAFFRSAYYVETDNYGFRWWLPSAPDDRRILSLWNSIPAKTQVQESSELNLDEPEFAYLQAGDSIYIDAWIENSEGISYSSPMLLKIKPGEVEFKFDAYSPSNAYNGTVRKTAYVSNRNMDIHTRFYSDPEMQDANPLPSGFYLLGTGIYELRAGSNNAMYVVSVGTYNPNEGGGGTPTNIMYSAYYALGYVNSPEQSCSLFYNDDPKTNIYYRFSSGKYFTSATSTIVVENGYYVLSEEGNWIKIIDGIKVQEGQC